MNTKMKLVTSSTSMPAGVGAKKAGRPIWAGRSQPSRVSCR